MDWQKHADEMIAGSTFEEGFLSAEELRRRLVAGGIESVIADSTISGYVAFVHDQLISWRGKCSELLELPRKIRPRIDRIKECGRAAIGPSLIAGLANSLDHELAKTRHMHHCVGGILSMSAALRDEYRAQGYSEETWDGLQREYESLPEVICYLTEVLAFLGTAGARRDEPALPGPLP